MKKPLVRGLLSLIVMAMSTASIAQAPIAKLQGVWKVVEVKTTGPNAATYANPQPGLVIFTAKHYSIMRVLSSEPRPDPPADTSKATAAELLAVWGPLQANTGTYEIAGDKLTMHPMVAKNPAVMASGVKQVSSIKLEKDTLWVTAVSGPAGPATNPDTWKLTRLE
jgi:hypothetical protein